MVQRTIFNLENCPNDCETSCYSCMNTYWNQTFQDELDRNKAADILRTYLTDPVEEETIPANHKQERESHSATPPERGFEVILKENRIYGYETQKKVDLGDSDIPYTIPDFVFKEAKLAIFTDGNTFHPPNRRRDKLIDMLLEDMGWKSIRILNSDLDDPVMQQIYLKEITKRLSSAPR